MSSRPIDQSHSASSASSLHRRDSNNHILSKVVRLALATIGIIASYAFLPPAGATIVSAVIIIATILSFSKLNSSSRTVIIDTDYDPYPVYVSPPWYSYIYRPRLWFPRLWFPRSRVRVPDEDYGFSSSSSRDRGRNVRPSSSYSGKRVPNGTGERTPGFFSSASNWISSNGFFSSTNPSSYHSSSSRDYERQSSSSSKTHIPTGRNKQTPSSSYNPPRSTQRSSTSSAFGSTDVRSSSGQTRSFSSQPTSSFPSSTRVRNGGR